MNTDTHFKNRIGQRLAAILLDAAENEELPQEKISFLAKVIQEELKLAETSADVFDFVEALAKEYPIFSSIMGETKATPVKNVHRRYLEQLVK